MQANLKIFLIALACLVTACTHRGKKSHTNFYNKISGWDIRYIPIVKPYRAQSIDRGVSWTMNTGDIGSIPLTSFAVSKNFIYGKNENGYFLFDVQTGLLAWYKTKDDLTNSIKSFNAPVNTLTACNTYFDSLDGGHTLYWFPNKGQKYPVYQPVAAAAAVIDITEKPGMPPDFKIDATLALKANKIYYFTVKYNHPDNQLYYLSIGNLPPVLASNNLFVPVFIDEDSFKIALYTPYPVAQKARIPESKRYLKSKIVYIN